MASLTFGRRLRRRVRSERGAEIIELAMVSPIFALLIAAIQSTWEERSALADLRSRAEAMLVGLEDTLMPHQGQIRNQKLDRYWTVGQWQDGFFHAVAGVGFSDYKPVRLKTGWA